MTTKGSKSRIRALLIEELASNGFGEDFARHAVQNPDLLEKDFGRAIIAGLTAAERIRLETQARIHSGRRKVNLGEWPTRQEVVSAMSNALRHFNVNAKDIEAMAVAALDLFRQRANRER